MIEINIPEIWKKDLTRIKGPPCPICKSEIMYWLSGPKTGYMICTKCKWEPQSSKESANK